MEKILIRVCYFALIHVAAAVCAWAQPAAAAHNDYSKSGAWLCRPGGHDACAADLSASIVSANGKLKVERFKSNPKAAVDCFYVYPTVSNDTTGNSDMTANQEELRVVQHQFARFASKCRVFAPLYRQITLTALRANLGGRPMAADRAMAYNDVLDAWNYYLQHDNEGRGVILIGHSQGSGVLMQLIRQEIDGKAFQPRLIAAYLLGMNVSVPKGKDVGGTFQHVPLCRSATQTGCVVSYVSFRADVPPPANSLFGRVQGEGNTAACVNPAALAGGSAMLDSYLGAGTAIASSAAPQKPWVNNGKTVSTPFVKVPGLISAECVSNDRETYLAVKIHANPADPRTDEISGDVMVNGQRQSNWGLHLIDAHLAMGNLVDLAGKQAKAYLSKAGDH